MTAPRSNTPLLLNRRAVGRRTLFGGTAGVAVLGYPPLLRQTKVVRAVIHLGASVAVGVPGADGELMFAPYRGVAKQVSPDLEVPITAALAEMRLLPLPAFNGEGKVWHEELPETPILSITGAFPQFHTPDDEPRTTTSLELLAGAYRAVRAATELVVGAARTERRVAGLSRLAVRTARQR